MTQAEQAGPPRQPDHRLRAAGGTDKVEGTGPHKKQTSHPRRSESNAPQSLAQILHHQIRLNQPYPSLPRRLLEPSLALRLVRIELGHGFR